MDSEISRYRVNQTVQAVLVRRAADLSRLHFSFTGNCLYLSGLLRKEPTGEFSVKDVQGLMEELTRLEHVRYIRSDLENWNVSQDMGLWAIQPKKRASRGRP